jgi:type IV secretory pathway VirB2 component (pilin)
LQAAPIFAADDTFGLDAGVTKVLQIIGSPWVRGVACIALIAECIGLLTAGKDNQQMFKRFIPWIVGTLLFLAAGTITNQFMSSITADKFKTDLGL